MISRAGRYQGFHIAVRLPGFTAPANIYKDLYSRGRHGGYVVCPAPASKGGKVRCVPPSSVDQTVFYGIPTGQSGSWRPRCPRRYSGYVSFGHKSAWRSYHGLYSLLRALNQP